MLRRFRPRLSYANVMVTLLVFFVFGGGAYAAFHLPKNSVRSRNIVNGQVKKPDLANHAVTGAKLAPASAWHEVSPLDTCATSTLWTNVAEGSVTAAYYRDPFGVVRLKGTVQCIGTPSTATILTLPMGFRPAGIQHFPATVFGPSFNSVRVQQDGQVVPESASGTQTFLSLDAVSFRCGPSGQHGCP